MTELKPCKFCGMSGHGLYVTSNAHDAPFVECNDCGACGPVESTEAEAIASWNRSGWQPIETYDRLKKPPKLAVFYVKPTTIGRSFLGEMVVTQRRYGYREVTHWMPLSEPPQ